MNEDFKALKLVECVLIASQKESKSRSTCIRNDLGDNVSYLCKCSRHRKIQSCKYSSRICHCWCKLHLRHRGEQKKCIRQYLNDKSKGLTFRSTLGASCLCSQANVRVRQDDQLETSSDSSLEVYDSTQLFYPLFSEKLLKKTSIV